MYSLPEEEFGLYAFSRLECMRCLTTIASNPYPYVEVRSWEPATGRAYPDSLNSDDGGPAQTGPEPIGDPAPVVASLHNHVYPWSQVKASKQGGPKPVCRLCGEGAPGVPFDWAAKL
jgi:hypothetical protein